MAENASVENSPMAPITISAPAYQSRCARSKRGAGATGEVGGAAVEEVEQRVQSVGIERTGADGRAQILVGEVHRGNPPAALAK